MKLRYINREGKEHILVNLRKHPLFLNFVMGEDEKTGVTHHVYAYSSDTVKVEFMPDEPEGKEVCNECGNPT